MLVLILYMYNVIKITADGGNLSTHCQPAARICNWFGGRTNESQMIRHIGYHKMSSENEKENKKTNKKENLQRTKNDDVRSCITIFKSKLYHANYQ